VLLTYGEIDEKDGRRKEEENNYSRRNKRIEESELCMG
jgi:hypothetical protein